MQVKLKISEKLENKLKTLLPNKVAEILLNASKVDVSKDILIDNDGYVDYLNGQISYIKESSRVRNNVQDPWLKSRQSTPPGGILSRIFKPTWINTNISNPQIEDFSNKWNAALVADQYRIEILRGWDILEAFNHKGTINLSKVMSCANFNNTMGYGSPMVKWYYVYIYNKENFGVLVLRDKKTGLIKARAPIFSGVQKFDDGQYKAGTWYRFLNTVYGETDLHKSCLRNWAVKRNIPYRDNPATFKGSFYIDFKTHYKTFPPLDNFFIDPNKNILSSNNNRDINTKHGLTMVSAYKYKDPNGNHAGKNGTNEIIKPIKVKQVVQ